MVGTPLDLIPAFEAFNSSFQVILDMPRKKDGSRPARARRNYSSRGRVRSHMQNIHDTAFREDKLQETRAAKQCMEECDMLTNDVEKSVSGMEHAFFLDNDHHQMLI